MKQVGICSMGATAPKKVLNNFDLEKMVETTDEWIVTRTGIRERHILANDERLVDLIVDSARTACSKSNISPDKLDFIISSTLTPDRISPAQAFEVAKELKANNGFCLDINAACSGFVYGLALAESILKTRDVSYGLVTAGEQVSRLIDYNDRASCVLFGDGAAAMVVTNNNPEHLILHTEMGADPTLADEVVIGGLHTLINENDRQKFYFRQNGQIVFRFAVSKIKELFQSVPLKAGINPADIRYVIPHQANMRIIEAASKEIIKGKTEFITNLEKYGNTSSASIGLAMNEAWPRFEKGDYILLIGFGAGLSWGAVLLQW